MSQRSMGTIHWLADDSHPNYSPEKGTLEVGVFWGSSRPSSQASSGTRTIVKPSPALGMLSRKPCFLLNQYQSREFLVVDKSCGPF